MGKKILVPCLDVIMIAFFSLVLEIWFFDVYFSGKRRSLLHPMQTPRKDLFLRKNVPKSA